jgi:chaperonin cofactor prefoldin
MSNEKTQLDRFKEAARELEADDDETKFNKKLGKLVKQKPDVKKDD